MIADYNTFVHTTAISVPALQALGTTWTAIGSTAAVDARDNTGTNPTVSAGEPIFLLNDTLIANNYADLWDNTIQTQINFTEIETVRNDFTWTGSNSLGLKDPFGLTLGSATGVEVGQITSLTIPWIAAGFSPTNTDLKPLYAISGVLTVVPEPHYLAVAALVFARPCFRDCDGEPHTPMRRLSDRLRKPATSTSRTMDNPNALNPVSWRVIMLRKFVAGCFCLLVIGSTATRLVAAVFVPAGLNPGDVYQLAFVTTGTTTATSAVIQDYNAFVNAQAALNPALTGTNMGVTWSAIGSTTTVNAQTNALVQAPVYLLNSTQIATGFADFWDGSLLAPINIDQFGQSSGATFAWTGSFFDGTVSVPPGYALRGCPRTGQKRQSTDVEPRVDLRPFGLRSDEPVPHVRAVQSLDGCSGASFVFPMPGIGAGCFLLS